ncbi:hypothetical protein BTE56_13705 [Agrobacterium pusense]|nr:hypothetical protein BTE56_13705 [Agrobacterium pusense]
MPGAAILHKGLAATLRTTLVPVPVTGFRSTRVCATGGSFQPRDLGWLDTCDKHRNKAARLAVG